MASDKALAIYSYSETVPLESRIDGFISLSVLQGHTSQATGEAQTRAVKRAIESIPLEGSP